MQLSDEPLVKASDRPVLKVLSLDPYCIQTLRRLLTPKIGIKKEMN
jgi:hypothetical protein